MAELVQLGFPSPHPSNSPQPVGQLQTGGPSTKPPATESLQLKVTGMTCAGCAASVQKALMSRPDVALASVSVTTGLALIEGSHLQTDSLIQTIVDRGFGAERLAEDVDTRSQIERQQQAAEQLWRHRAIVGLGLWIPLELFHWVSTALHWHPAMMPWLMFAGSLIVVAFAGSAFFRSALVAAKRGTTNMDTLISIGALSAFGYSAINLFLGTHHATYFSEAAGLLGIVSLGHWLEARASAHAGSAVRELLKLQPETAELVSSDGSSSIVPSLSVVKGQRLQIRPGARIPVDGVVINGSSDVDESVVTGESIPVHRRDGDPVVAGSMNTTGQLIIEATVSGHETTISRMAELVQKSQTSRAPVQKLADEVSAIFVPTVLFIALMTLTLWSLLGYITHGFISAVTVLIISCPCALGLATPMAVMVGTGSASQRGILIKSAAALEQIGRSMRVVFDKTGTLTTGHPAVSQIVPVEKISEQELLALAAAVEQPSEHPVAKAIVAAARERKLTIDAVSDFRVIPGSGVSGIVNGQEVRVERDSVATARVIQAGHVIGTINVLDVARGDAASAVRRLHDMHVQVFMLSGDKASTAHEIGSALGIDASHIVAEATPQQKTEFIRRAGQHVVMVGDGLNDAAALAQSGLGVAMASGTNVAIDAASVVIPGDRVEAIADLFTIARATLTTIRQNLFFAFFYNAVAIPLAAFGLLGSSGPLWAAAAMGLSDITVVGNALRLRRRLKRSGNLPPKK
ncbi:MAG: heavy metal translocating P-type ATPase [Planctomycetaceae bacterium]